MLSQKAKYAIKALLALSRAPRGQLLQSKDISQKHNIPKKFLDLIFFELRGHGLIHSTRGREGGYALSQPPDSITMARIVRAVDGPLAPLPCASVTAYRRCDDCADEKTCEVRKVMREVRDAASAILDNMTLADAAALNKRKPQPKSKARASVKVGAR
jgi:Rrf2 family protein